MRALGILLLAASASAQGVDREVLTVLGWNKACSVALTHYGYPAIGAAIADEPVAVRIGSLTIPPEGRRSRAKFLMAVNGPYAYQPAEMKASIAKLKEAGYTALGIRETIRPDPTPVGPEDAIRSTMSLSASAPAGWPGPGYQLQDIFYSPLGTCALLVYRREGFAKDFFTYLLTRVEDPRARLLRSRAHMSRGLALLGAGDLQEALEEMKIAATLSPNNALARYHHAAALCLAGRMTESMDELAAAVESDRALKAQARQDRDFEPLFKDRRFKEITFEKQDPYRPAQGGATRRKPVEPE